ncbi:hypothetical protein Rhow_005037 [Rhodococcus wratislaviensis]|uniref:Uncharacterized protein n=1 Tax=Rhodococcus wratislaviensis TaxID=44752 RepID=A0A402CCQ4_RHOWR|nr:hypothetical protein Rhow_005037 [Rhodococcus wratislaviensis]
MTRDSRWDAINDGDEATIYAGSHKKVGAVAGHRSLIGPIIDR